MTALAPHQPLQTHPPHQPHQPRNPWLVLAVTSLAVFAVFLDTTILFVAFPAISRDFDTVGPSSLSWILNAYTIVFAAMLIPAGRLADRVGRRRTFVTAVVVFTVASMLCGLAPTAGLLVLGRVVQAIGAAALVPASLALVLQTFPRDKVPVAVAIWGAIGALAGAAGPTLGAVVVEHLGWRWAFYINLPVGLVSLVLGRRVLPEGRESEPGRLPDPVGVVLLAAGLALVAYGIVQTDRWGWADALFVAVEVAAAALIWIFVGRCRRVANPLLDLALFEVNDFRWANAATVVFAVGFNAMFLGNVLFLTRVWGYSILRAGMAISVGPLVVATTAPWLGRLAGRIGQRRLLVPGGIVWASGGLYLLARATTHPHFVAHYLPAVALTGLGVSLCLPQLSSAAARASRRTASVPARPSTRRCATLAPRSGSRSSSRSPPGSRRRTPSAPSSMCGGCSWRPAWRSARSSTRLGPGRARATALVTGEATAVPIG